jgi:hypothetical protein
MPIHLQRQTEVAPPTADAIDIPRLLQRRDGLHFGTTQTVMVMISAASGIVRV